MSAQQEKELENAMNLQAEAQAAEARGQQPAMEKAEEKGRGDRPGGCRRHQEGLSIH